MKFQYDGLPQLPIGYSDSTNNDDAVCIVEGYNENYVCCISSENDAIAVRYGLARWDEYCKTQAQGFFSVVALLFSGKEVLAVSRKTNHADTRLARRKD